MVLRQQPTGPRSFLRAFDISNSAVLAHNMQFDGAILAWRLGLYPKMLVDTLSMARPIYGAVQSLSLANLSKSMGLGEKGTEVIQALGKRRADFTPDELAAYGGYCCNDAELCFKLFELLKPQTTDQELRLIDATLRLFTQPMLALDRPTLEAHLAAVLKRQAELLDVVAAFTVVQKGVEVGKLSDSQAVALRQRLVADPTVAKTLGGGHHDLVKPALMSNPQFADLLRLAGVEPPVKISTTTGKEAYAFAKTDAGLTALLEHEDILVQSLVAARLGVKSTIEQTRTERFLGIASRGTWPVDLNYAGADTTWRWSGGGKVNAQNLTRGGETAACHHGAARAGHRRLRLGEHRAAREPHPGWAGVVRHGVPPGHGPVLRVCQPAVRARNHRHAGEQGRAVPRQARALSLGYGCGWKKFQEICRQKGVILSDTRAREIVDLWRAVYGRIPEQWARLDEALKAMYHGSVMEIGKGLVLTFREEGVCGFWLPNNRRIRYYDLQPGGSEDWLVDTATPQGPPEHLRRKATRIWARPWPGTSSPTSGWTSIAG